jgi:hypothetical protein
MKNNYLMLGALTALAAILTAAFGSCSTEDAAASSRMIGGASTALTYQNCKAVSQDVVEFTFSQPVTVKGLTLDPQLSVESIENGSTVRIKLAETQIPGRLINADLIAEDEKRNSINVLVSFRARNDRMPDLIINEICTEYASVTAGRKAEFIELKMKSAGNLGAMRLCIVGNSNASMETIYEFSPAEVKKDDYVVVHLRTLDPESVDELGNNLAESKGLNASPSARDFWIPGNTKLIHKTSIVYILDQDDEVLSAVMICEKPDLPWPKDYFNETIGSLLEKGAWIKDPVPSAGATNTRTICRDETAANTKSAADWYITATSSATPGSVNNPKRYVN